MRRCKTEEPGIPWLSYSQERSAFIGLLKSNIFTHYLTLQNLKNWSMWDWRKKLYASPKCCINSSVLPRKRKITNSFPPSSHLATLHECLRLSPPVRKKKTSQLCIVFKILIQSPKVTQMCSVLLSSHWRDLGFLKVLGSKSDSVTDTSDYKQPTAGYCWRWVT